MTEQSSGDNDPVKTLVDTAKTLEPKVYNLEKSIVDSGGKFDEEQLLSIKADLDKINQAGKKILSGEE